MIKIKRALLSVHDKSGLKELGKALSDQKVEIIATGSTAAFLRDNNISSIPISDYTGFPEILHGRVKTLHSKIFGGILARSIHGELQEISSLGIPKIDLLVVNLYPFSATAATTDEEQLLLDEIDIGGVSLIRAAAKNYRETVILPDPQWYPDFLEDYAKNAGAVSLDISKKLMKVSFFITSRYDWAIFQKFNEMEGQVLDSPVFKKRFPLRYGENPHQKASYWVHMENDAPKDEIMGCKVLHGKELSYNNLMDISSGMKLLDEFDLPSCAIMKHTNPCGVCSAQDIKQAYHAAYQCDPVSAFGGIYLFNREITPEIADLLSQLFVEVIVAPSFHQEALRKLTEKKNIRILHRFMQCSAKKEFRSLYQGYIVQDVNSSLFEEIKVIGGRPMEQALLDDIAFGVKVSKHMTSNAVVIVKDQCTLGMGIGQCNRVQSAKIALEQAGEKTKGAVLVSDGFLPFADTIEQAKKQGISVVAEPGGSIRDAEVISAAEKHGISLVFTGLRHFKH